MLDYSNTSHVKTCYMPIAPLETKYDGKSSSLHTFMNSVLNRAKNFGWSNILNINDSGQTTRNLLNEYGQLTMEEVKNHAQTNWTNQPMRDAQNSEMMYHFLFESLDDSFKATVLLKKSNYMMTVWNYTTEDGPCILKQIIVSTFVDTRATAAQIRESLVDKAQQWKNKKETLQNLMNGWNIKYPYCNHEVKRHMIYLLTFGKHIKKCQILSLWNTFMNYTMIISQVKVILLLKNS